MRQNRSCPKCESKDVIEDAYVLDRGHMNGDAGELALATYKKPDAFLFKGKRSTAISAWVCGKCGYLELYADSPQMLREV